MWTCRLRCCLRLTSVVNHKLFHSFTSCVSREPLSVSSTMSAVKPKTFQRYATLVQSTEPVKQKFDYFFVLDFEATCDRIPIQPQEIIEFPCLKLNGKTLDIEASFHQYVQPRVHKALTPYCIELTGIVQDMIDNQPDIEVTLQLFDNWMKKEGAFDEGVKFTFVTCGDWDLNIMLPNECQYFKLPVPRYMTSWINIKKPFVNVTGIWPKGLLHMMSIVGLQHKGRLHSGIDDCHNLAKVLKVLHEKGYVLDVTGQLE